MPLTLTAKLARIFRIVHRQNVPWILDHGLHARTSECKDPDYIAIGNPDLIEKRGYRTVPIPPGGTLSDYVPFYFTPHSPMFLNIKTGYGGIPRHPNDDIVILGSSMATLAYHAVSAVFTDRHAYLTAAQFFSQPEDLEKIDWRILQAKAFRRDPDDPGKLERYQAEALAHQHVPVQALLGIVCHSAEVKLALETEIARRGLALSVDVRREWYF